MICCCSPLLLAIIFHLAYRKLMGSLSRTTGRPCSMVYGMVWYGIVVLCRGLFLASWRAGCPPSHSAMEKPVKKLGGRRRSHHLSLHSHSVIKRQQPFNHHGTPPSIIIIFIVSRRAAAQIVGFIFFHRRRCCRQSNFLLRFRSCYGISLLVLLTVSIDHLLHQTSTLHLLIPLLLFLLHSISILHLGRDDDGS